MPLALGNLVLDTGGRNESLRIDYFEPVVGEAHDFFLAKDLERSADVNVGEAQCLTNLALAERQLNSLTLLGRKPAANSHVEFEDEMRDALPGVPKTDIGEVVMRARFIGGDLATQQDRETRIVLDDNVQLAPRKCVDAHYREAPSGVIYRGIRRLLKAKDRTRKCEI
jgi:hypothetical protein